MYRISPVINRLAWGLLAGAALATLWVNLSPEGYRDAIEWRIVDLPLPAAVSEFPVSVTPMGLVSEILMAFFVFVIGKEFWEALVVEKAAFAGRGAAVPAALVAGTTLGGALVWVLAGALSGTAAEAGLATGWTVPIGADAVLAYVFGRMVFGARHPALHLLLLVTIAGGILGLVLTGLAVAPHGLRPQWLLLPLVASLGVWWLYGRRPGAGAPERQQRHGLALWPYVVAGLVSLGGVLAAGLPGALGLLPVIPAIPHAGRSFGVFAEAEGLLHDPLNRLAHLMTGPMPVVLFLYALTHGGIEPGAFGPTTLTVLAAFWIGRPLGLMAAGWALMRLAPALWPRDITARDLAQVAVLAGLGFTVPLLAAAAALPGGSEVDAERLGQALTLLAGPAALILARLTGRRRRG